MRAPAVTIARARALRRRMTLPEVLLWQALRRGGLAGLRVRRQHPLGAYILDFYCPSCRLAIEVDGCAHDGPERAAHDGRREAWLAGRGVRLLRLAAADILDDRRRGEALASIAAIAGASDAPSTAFRTE